MALLKTALLGLLLCVCLHQSFGQAVQSRGPPQNLKLESVFDDPLEAELSWSPPLDVDGLDNYRVEVTSTHNMFTMSYITTIPHLTIEELRYGVNYTFSVSASYTDGYGERAVISWETPDMPDSNPCGKPKDLVATGVTSRSVQLGWSVPEANLSNGAITGYTVAYFRERNITMIRTIENVTKSSYFLDYLMSNTTYTARVRAFNSVGKCSWGKRITFTTLEDNDPPPAALTECYMSRINDAYMLSPSWVKNNFTSEATCVAACEKLPMCSAATYRNATRDCSLHPRREFKMGYITGQGCCVMFEKYCPKITDIRYSGVAPRVFTICPLVNGGPAPDKKYAYSVYRQLTTPTKISRAYYLCMGNKLCAAATYNVTGKRMTYFYKTTPAPNAVSSNTTLIRQCMSPSGTCNGIKVMKYKTVRGQRSYRTFKLKRGEYWNVCAVACQQDNSCIVAILKSIFRDCICKLYHTARPMIVDHVGRGSLRYLFTKVDENGNRICGDL